MTEDLKKQIGKLTWQNKVLKNKLDISQCQSGMRELEIKLTRYKNALEIFADETSYGPNGVFKYGSARIIAQQALVEDE
jgi:hypothetical protein